MIYHGDHVYVMIPGNVEEIIRGLTDARDEFNKLLATVWCKIIQEKDLSKKSENDITKEIVKEARMEQNELCAWKIEYQYFDIDTPEGETDGTPDIAITLPRFSKPYLAYECKWLEKPGQASSLVSHYCGENGIGCFESGKYSCDMPVGNMIGYVYGNGINNVTSVYDRLRKKLVENSPTELEPFFPNGLLCDLCKGTFISNHFRESYGPIVITHFLLSIGCHLHTPNN